MMSRSNALAALAALTAVWAETPQLAAHTDAHTGVNDPGDPVLKLVMVEQAGTKAACLDGTPVGFYFRQGVGIDAYNYVIFLEGGGWCYDVGDCFGRAHGSLGSSTGWPATTAIPGLLGPCNVSSFCNWTMVFVPYCDGNSFSGMREDPVVFNNMSLYFRGRYNLDAVVNALNANVMQAKVPFSQAFDVVLTGCSAGGLSTYLHADYVGSLLPAVRPPPPGGPRRNGLYRAISISGFFLNAPNVDGQYVYADQIKTIHYLANSTHGTNDDCVQGEGPGNEWRCNMAQYVYKYIKTPVFALNSMYDSWSAECILTAEPVTLPNDTSHNGNCSAVPGWAACAQNVEACTNAQISVYNKWRSMFIQDMNGTATANAVGNGGFLTSCHTHCEGQNDHDYAHFTINGVTMRQAVLDWMNSDAQDPSSKHFYWDCEYNADGSPHDCNPVCSQ